MHEADSNRPVVCETEDRVVQAIEVVLRSWRDQTRERIATVGVGLRPGNLHRRRNSPFYAIEPYGDAGQGRAIGVIDAASTDRVGVGRGLLFHSGSRRGV